MSTWNEVFVVWDLLKQSSWMTIHVCFSNKYKTLSLYLRSMFPQTHQDGIPMILKQLKTWTEQMDRITPHDAPQKSLDGSITRPQNFRKIEQGPQILMLKISRTCSKYRVKRCLGTPKPICRRDWSTRDNDSWYSPPSKKKWCVKSRCISSCRLILLTKTNLDILLKSSFIYIYIFMHSPKVRHAASTVAIPTT